MMAVLEDTIQLVHDHHGEKIDLSQLPANDPVVYETLQKADTVGMFQIESRTQMSCPPRLRPQCFYDIVVQVAIIRELAALADGTFVRVAGGVIARQRPGTAKGFVFLSLEDETGISNAIIAPQLFEQDHTVVVQHPFLLLEGQLQNQDGVVSVKVQRVQPLRLTQAEPPSHDFH